MRFAQKMATPAGRLIRIVAGIGLIIWGIVQITSHASVWGIAVILIGAVLTIVGSLNVCPLALLFGGPFSGRRAQQAAAARR